MNSRENFEVYEGRNDVTGRMGFWVMLLPSKKRLLHMHLPISDVLAEVGPYGILYFTTRSLAEYHTNVFVQERIAKKREALNKAELNLAEFVRGVNKMVYGRTRMARNAVQLEARKRYADIADEIRRSDPLITNLY